jgi:hypothetical protein
MVLGLGCGDWFIDSSPCAKARGISGILFGSETLVYETDWNMLVDNIAVSFILQ